ncbi:hypothetical protein MTR67_044366 [Solanum verrucosum]|uniref:Uncharacterized protein n=1 Tax=Solanum verrucosum TaxID=315347 RepID=A0AAF0UTT2_SOLVR|nr:hypothetical protein MTR67_044366 [Solanum verrucosum]
MEPEQYFDEAPNEEAKHFYDQLEESSRPLCEGSLHSALSVAVRLMNIKSDWNVPNAAMDSMVDLLGELVNLKFKMPKNFYQAKRLVSKLELTYDRIHCCVNDSMLFYKTASELEKLLKRLYASMRSAPHMRWHREYRMLPGVLSHPSDGKRNGAHSPCTGGFQEDSCEEERNESDSDVWVDERAKRTFAEIVDGVQIAAMSAQIEELTSTLIESERRR